MNPWVGEGLFNAAGSTRTASSKPIAELTGMKVHHDGNVVVLSLTDHPRFSPPRPVRSNVNVNDVGRLLTGTTAAKFASCPLIRPPFGPQGALGVGRKQFSLPSFRRTVGQGLHHGRHAAG